jgi:dCTP deaminase
VFLTAVEIRESIRRHELRISPFSDSLLKPASYALRLGTGFRRWMGSSTPIDFWEPESCAKSLSPIEECNEILLQPGDFLLARSLETIGLPVNLIGLLSTLSHLARAGISATRDSFLVSPAFGDGAPTELTFEVTSSAPMPVRLYSGMPFCHLLLSRIVSSETTFQLERSVFEGRRAPDGPMMHLEFAKPDVALPPNSASNL